MFSRVAVAAVPAAGEIMGERTTRGRGRRDDDDDDDDNAVGIEGVKADVTASEATRMAMATNAFILIFMINLRGLGWIFSPAMMCFDGTYFTLAMMVVREGWSATGSLASLSHRSV
jgi:hypothetical protein